MDKEIIYPSLELTEAAVKPEAETVNKETLQLLTRHYTDQFWSGLTKTSVILLAWITALALVFHDPIFSLPEKAEKQSNQEKDITRQLGDIEIKLNEISVKTMELGSTRESGNKISAAPNAGDSTGRDLGAPQALAPDDKPRSKVRRSIESGKETRVEAGQQPADDPKIKERERLNTEREKLSEKKDKLLEKRQSVLDDLTKLRSPFGELSIRTVYATAIWSVLFWLLLIIFLYKRIVLTANLAKVVELQTKDPQRKLSSISGLGSWTPFWLAPLPKEADKSSVSTDDLKQYLGWVTGARWRSRLTIICVIIAFIFHLWVVRIALQLISLYRLPELALINSLLVVAIFLSSIVICVTWLRPTVRLGTFPENFFEVSKVRRKILWGTVSLLGLGFISVLTVLALRRKTANPIWAQSSSPRFPRFKLRPRVNKLDGLEGTFQLNKKSKVLHFIGRNGWTSDRVALNPVNLEKKGEEHIVATLTEATRNQSGTALKQKTKQERFNKTQAAALCECLALEKFQSGDSQQALKLLWGGILLDTELKQRMGQKRPFRQKQSGNITSTALKHNPPPSYRLYDLYAGLAFRLSDRLELTKLIEHAERNWGDNKPLGKRVNLWRNPSPEWEKKWRNGELPWKPPKGDPKKDPNLYSGYCS